MTRIVTEEEIARAERTPPPGTRAYFRGRCAEQFPAAVYGASWTSVMIDVGNTTIKRIPLMDPSRGTRALTGALLDGCATAQDLLAKLKS